MVDINIKNGQGISQALAEYAKNLNGGKALKLNAKQWQSIMTKIDEINNNRSKDSVIFHGNNNIFGSTRKNFVVQAGKLSFSNEEMASILKEMGLDKDIIDEKFAIKGLSIERESSSQKMNAPQQTPTVAVQQPKIDLSSLAEQTPPAETITFATTLDTEVPQTAKKANLSQPADLPAQTAPDTNTPASQAAENPTQIVKERNTPLSQPAELPAQAAQDKNTPATVQIEQPVIQNENTPTGVTSPIMPTTATAPTITTTSTTTAGLQTPTAATAPSAAVPTDLSAEKLTAPATPPVLETEISQKPDVFPAEKVKTNADTAGNNEDISFLDQADNMKFFYDGQIRSLDLKIEDLDWDRRGRKEWNKNHSLDENNADYALVKDNQGKVIANFHEGKYYIGNKEVSLEKFQKFANKNGDIITINYSPEINTIKAKGTGLPEIKTHDILTKNLEKIKIEPQEAPIPKKYTRKHLTPEFYNRVIDIAEKIKCKPEDLLAVMNSESGLNPSSISRWTGATGLIQFMPETARSLGTSVEELATMSPLEQLDYVEKFLVRARKAHIKGDKELSAGDLYGLVFMPAKSGQEVLAVKGTKAYKQNKGLDYDGDGIISRKDLEAHVRQKHVDVKLTGENA